MHTKAAFIESKI